VVIAWVVVLFGASFGSKAAGSGFSTAFSLPNVESARGFDILDTHFKGQAASGNGGSIVFKSTKPITDPSVQGPMSEFLDQVGAIKPLHLVSPYSPAGQRQVASSGALAGRIAYASVDVPRSFTVEKSAKVAKQVKAMAPTVPGLQIEYGGQIFAKFAAPSSETLGLAFAVVILVMAFGSVLAMGLPVATALGGIGLGVAIVTLLSNVILMPDFTLSLAGMIGLGVGIDYALFIVTRYREGIHAGLDTEHATGLAVNTAGRAVLFAGVTVVISLLGMLLMNLAFVRGLAIGAAVTVVMTMAASITLLPALLGFAGNRLELTRWRGLIAASLAAIGLFGLGSGLKVFWVAFPMAAVVLVVGLFLGPLKREVPKRAPKARERTLPYRWSQLIQRRPWPAVVVGAVVLGLLAIPLFSIRLGFSDDGNAATSTTTRRAYDLLAEGFGPGFNGPLVLASEVPAGADLTAGYRITAALNQDPGVAFASPPIGSPDGKAYLWQVVPKSSPQDKATSDLVYRLRSSVLPPATAGSGLKVAVTGFVAVSTDFSHYLGARLPLFIGVVLALSFLLLMVVFRSVLVPLKAVIMNLASIGAAYGLVVAVFQWGWAKDVFGIGKGGPIEPFVPMMMFAIVFGLSMDYEVFLLSRIKEAYDHGAENAKAVADGLTATATVITAAAAIMVFVFGSFLLEPNRVLKLFGLGLASAVLLDATVVRMLLVPAAMELLGDRNWWVPKWLGKILPEVHVEGTGDDTMADIEGAVPAPV
jgi:RND superfamily putative drug exporter